ncbi:MAG TPA: hypothetical protein VNF71_02025 [Acidimicrobiales bacterium]|nr:hypothetical protein [Acidimicrobiales bacterium]
MTRAVGRLVRVGLLSGALACAVIGIGVAPAGATGGRPPSIASSSIHVGDDCTYYSTGHIVGKTTFFRLGNYMLIFVSFSHAIPNTTYPLYLFRGSSYENFCESSTYIGHIHTSGRGTGSGFYVTAFTPSDVYFFLGATNEATYSAYGTSWNESTLFFLPTPSHPPV